MKKKKSISPVLIIALVLSIVALGVCIAFVLGGQKPSGDKGTTGNTQGTAGEPGKQVEIPSSEDYEKKNGKETFVIFGVDSREDELGSGTRSDSIMIVYVDHDAQNVKVASVFRDCMVHIEGHGYQKITHAHQFGGPELALSTVNENFDLDAANYVTVNFESVSELVELLGGIEYTITDAEAKYMGERFTGAGTYLLNGDEVVTYSRIRSTAGGDYKRSERQREMLFCIFEKAKTLSTEDRIELVEVMLKEINTSYHEDEMLEILYYLSEYNIGEMAAFPEVFYGGTVDGAWVEVPVTLVDMNTALHKFLYGETDYAPSETVQTYSSVMAGKVSGANHDFRED